MSPGQSFSARLTTGRVLFGALLAVQLAPIWAFTYFPSQDGPIHVYNAKLLFEQLDPANYQVRQFFRPNLALHPNCLTHVALALLQTAFAPLVAEKLLLSALVALLPMALLYLRRGLQAEDDTFALAGFLFATHNLLHVGFYNFSLGLSMCLLALGYWWRHRHAVGVRQIAVFNLLFLATYLAHFAAFAALVIVTSTSVCWSLLLAACGRMRATDEAPSLFAARLRSAAAFAGYALPAFAFAADYYLRSAAPQRDRYHTVARLWETVWQTLVLSSYTDWHRWIAQAFIVLLVLAVLSTLGARAAARCWPQERDALVVASAILAACYFTLPWWKNDGGWVNDRILLFVVLLPAAWVQLPSRTWRVVAAALLTGLSLAHAGRLAYEYALLQPELHEFGAALHMIRPHSTVDEDLEPAATTRSDAFPEPLRYVAPFVHAASYYGLGRDVALYRNYETALPYFLIRPGEAERTEADYVVTWRLDEDGRRSADYASAYDLVYSTRHLKLFRLKPVPPDSSLWSRTDGGHMRLRLGMDWGGAATGWQALPRESLYVPGRHGWLGLAPTLAWPTAGRDGADFAASVADERDRTFRISLPNGSYRVTCTFTPAPNGDYEVNLIANDRVVGRHVEVRRGAGVRALEYEVRIADELLTQVFYSTRARSTDLEREVFWALSGIAVEALPASGQP